MLTISPPCSPLGILLLLAIIIAPATPSDPIPTNQSIPTTTSEIKSSDYFFDWSQFLDASVVHRTSRLLYTVRVGDWIKAEKILTKRIHINQADRPTGRTAFWYTLFDRRGRLRPFPNFQLANRLLQMGAQADWPDMQRITPFWSAAAQGSLSLMQWLLQIDPQINLNSQDSVKGYTPLLAALWDSPLVSGQFSKATREIVSFLINREADLSIADFKGHTALFAVIIRQQCDWVEIFRMENIASGKLQLNIADNQGFFPIHYAFYGKSSKCVRYLLEASPVIDTVIPNSTIADNAIANEVDVNCRDPFGNTPLMLAITGGEPEHLVSIDLLLKRGVRLSDQNRRGWSALHLAVGGNRPDLAEYLLENGADLEQEVASFEEAGNFKGDTALIIAVSRRLPAMVEMLLRRGADVNHANLRGETPIMLAPAFNNPKIVLAILRRRPLLDAQDNLQRSALHYSVLENTQTKTELLLQAGARTDLLDALGLSPLMMASVRENLAALEKLCASDRVAINQQQPGSGKTALMLALEVGKVQVARFLVIKCGASASGWPLDGDDRDALHYASALSEDLAAELFQAESRSEIFYSASSSPVSDI